MELGFLMLFLMLFPQAAFEETGGNFDPVPTDGAETNVAGGPLPPRSMTPCIPIDGALADASFSSGGSDSFRTGGCVPPLDSLGVLPTDGE